MRVLILGAGAAIPRRKIALEGKQHELFSGNDEIVTLDMNKAHLPDILLDLSNLHLGGTLPVPEDYFDEIHAYEVLEHVGLQGDYLGFFREWKEYWRVLKPGGRFHGSSPKYDSCWAWGDPGHTRVMDARQFAVILNQAVYERDVGKTSMSDYRAFWPKPFSFKPLAIAAPDEGESTYFILEKEVAQ